MKKNQLRLCFLLPAALICILVVIMASADNTTSTDPLISLSYLNGTFKTQLMTEVQTTLNSEITAMENRINQRIDGVKAAASAQSPAAPTHSTATIPANSSYSVPGGSEFLFLSGEAAVTTAGLTDLTDGVSVAAQGKLSQYHLYTATAPVTIQATVPAKIVIRK